MKNEKRNTLLYSGGIDSLIAYKMLSGSMQINTLYVDINHRYNKQEVRSVTEEIPSTIVSTSDYGLLHNNDEDQHGYAPGKNLILCLHAAAMLSDNIYLIATKREVSIPDRDSKFFNRVSMFLSWQFGREIKVLNPYSHNTKAQLVKWYLDIGYNPESLINAFSCYYSFSHRPCNKCHACFRKAIALTLNDIDIKRHFKVDDLYHWASETYNPEVLKKLNPTRVLEITEFFRIMETG